MKIVYYSNLFFTDCDFPLVKAMQQSGVTVFYFIEIVISKQCGGLFDLRDIPLREGIYNATSLDAFNEFIEYMDLSNTYIVVRKPGVTNITCWKTYIELCFKIKKLNPSVLHITQALGFVESLLYFFRKKMVMTVHDPFLHSGEHNSKSEKKRIKAFKNARKLILLNKNQEKDFAKYYRLPQNKIFQNQLGTYECLNFLADEKQGTSFGKYILFFGHISPYKGVDILCESMKIVHKEIPELKCIIAGKGTFNFNIEEYMKLDYFQFINDFIEIKNLGHIIKNALFVVCPYKDATQSGVVYSSFALNKPIIASNVGGLGESIVDGETGYLIPANDSVALAKKIKDLVKEPVILEQMVQNIVKSYSMGKNSWHCIAIKYKEIYDAIV